MTCYETDSAQTNTLIVMMSICQSSSLVRVNNLMRKIRSVPIEPIRSRRRSLVTMKKSRECLRQQKKSRMNQTEEGLNLRQMTNVKISSFFKKSCSIFFDFSTMYAPNIRTTARDTTYSIKSRMHSPQFSI